MKLPLTFLKTKKSSQNFSDMHRRVSLILQKGFNTSSKGHVTHSMKASLYLYTYASFQALNIAIIVTKIHRQSLVISGIVKRLF